MKNRRHQKIMEIINKRDVETQEDLINLLRKEGFEATQATISRDMRELSIVKIATKNHRYRYSVSEQSGVYISNKYINILRTTIISVDCAENMVALRTYSGMAQAAAAAIDGMGWDEIVGTLAGDDTIFVLMRDIDAACDLVVRLRSIVK